MLNKWSTPFSALSPWEFSVGKCTDPKQRSFQHLTSFSLTSHHSILALPSVAITMKASSPKSFPPVTARTLDLLFLILKFQMWGVKKAKKKIKKRDLGGSEWDCWYNMLLMSFRLCRWRLCRWMLRLCNKSTPHACTEHFIRPKSASVKWLKVDSPAGSMTWGPRP